MKVIVTGGAGFIGSHLVELLLEKGAQVVVLDNFSTGRQENLEHIKNSSNLVVQQCDLGDDLNSFIHFFKDTDYVFHLAALADIVPSIKRPLDYHRSNVTSTVNVVEASRQMKVKKFIYAASSSCYGIVTQFPTSEQYPVDPQYPYALTKYLGEQYVFHWGKVYGLKFISLRLFNVYGPRSRTSGTYGAVFGVFLAQKLSGKPFTVVGDGNQKRDFVFVKDVVEAFYLAAMSSLTGEIFNVGSGQPHSINELVELLGGDKVYLPKRPGEPDCTHADITKIKKMLGWEPKVSFEEGVKIMLDNIDYWRDAPVWTKESIEEETAEWFKYLSSE